jgi:ubiquinone/menaquinone biosynthesis C-methylase UbiE
VDRVLAGRKYSGRVKITEATALIRTAAMERQQPQHWCDLGCGSGTFTTALAHLLAPGSAIHAIDIDQTALDRIPDEYGGVTIHKVLADLRSPSLRLPAVDGILMANSLHFIQDQDQFLRRLAPVADRYLVVEYERSKPNRWGPYPVAFERLRELFREAGIERVERLATRVSRFGGTIYSAYAERP